jgi:hypothetical protein
MKRTPMKRTPFKRKAPQHQPAVEREPKPLARATRPATYAGQTTGEIKKKPHTVNHHLRNLARGEICTGLLYGGYCHCDPDTTVWAHTNCQTDAKGTGYKAHDHLGMFLGLDCHSWLDTGKGTAEEKAAFVAGAQARTRDRLAEIAASPTLKPWRREAARWALEQLAKEGA